jgi:flagellar biosynthesis protein FlhB
MRATALLKREWHASVLAASHAQAAEADELFRRSMLLLLLLLLLLMMMMMIMIMIMMMLLLLNCGLDLLFHHRVVVAVLILNAVCTSIDGMNALKNAFAAVITISILILIIIIIFFITLMIVIIITSTIIIFTI